MATNTNYLLELDVEKLFEEQNIEDIIQIESSLDAEIERKRNELRSMVGDRYKDILTASDAIKSMKCISEDIVNNIERITSTCQELLSVPPPSDKIPSATLNKSKIEERTLAIQIRLALFINEQIWICLDDSNNLKAAQFYLLAQHIHTGISLTKQDLLQKIPLIQQIRSNLLILRSRIFQCISDKLESVEITAEETSCNLNALMLLQNQSTNELLSVFIEHRKSALNTVINKPHSNVRLQISAMVRCLITTVHLLHDCFMYNSNNRKGLIWQQLDEIIGGEAPTTFSKLQLPSSPLISYIPDIIRQFKPKCMTEFHESTLSNTKELLDEWWRVTKDCVKKGLESSLQLVTNIKGLYLIREEALKIELPPDWEKICKESNLPDKFNVWYNFFQNLITERARILITNKIVNIVDGIQADVCAKLVECEKFGDNESDIRWYTWKEDSFDVSKTTNQHIGLSMKTKGYSPNIVDLCSKLDNKFYELLEDVWQYLYGKEYNTQQKIPTNLVDFKFKRKFIDKEELENHLRIESTKESLKITSFILDLVNEKSDRNITKSILSARFLHASLQLCPNFNTCCTFNDSTDDWLKICDNFNKTNCLLLENWIDKCVETTETEIENFYSIKEPQTMLRVLTKWDCIEIQEQTDEKVFKSQIKVPLKPSLKLTSILIKLNNDLSAVLPHTLPKIVHIKFIERNINIILNQYKILSDSELNQIQALNCLFDVKFLTTFCIQRENVQLVNYSQEICDKFRNKIDPFDLDVFYSYLQSNVKRAVCQSQMILGCLLPSSNQLASLGEKIKEQDKEPSILALSSPSSNSWFPLLPITKPSHKMASTTKDTKNIGNIKSSKSTPRKSQDSSVRSSAASLFGNLTTDWFS